MRNLKRRSRGIIMNNIILFSVVSLINDISSKMILPVLPLYIKQIGGTGLAIGLISGLGESLASLLKLASGYWSDKLRKRKPFVILGYAISEVSKLLFYFANTWPIILVLRSFERMGKGLRSASRDAMLASSSEKRGKAFGIHRAFDSGGAVIGSIAVLILVALMHTELRDVFLYAGIIGLFAIPWIFFAKEKGTEKTTDFKFSFSMLPKKLKRFIIASTIFAFGNFSYMFFVLESQKLFTGADQLIFPVVLFIIYYLVYTIFAVPVGLQADKIGKNKIITLGYGLFIPVTAGFIFFKDFWIYIALFILYGLMFAFVESNERAYVSDLSDPKIRATALGTFFALTSIVALPAGLLAGYLYDIHPYLTFSYGLVTSVIAVIIMLGELK